ncbi:alkyl hydroperoxide reductase/ Thiol specific antioxidant/ Mal allergen [Caldalkalibacillus thermarum TA2.A1]|uniref:Alkyl hydroperoxide reductase/ Thiol specific antioxidant/ Mal allergen n=2 Tax=Caldalkalibacillus TaxID=379065 RepID=F5L7Q7_CALTT|nr:alkyl hydroperoxide reductase/ Thiol specific antioxidant/ Mal allergen [Caldalkalibacillus thermarum TA2.A1]QZT33338.1 redoxin domain-containing protein [Caldalkalibacillus thermarum TA2.A1]
MPSYEDDLPRFEEHDTQVLGISVDSVFSHKAWAKSLGGITYPLLADFYPHGEVSKKYGVFRDNPDEPAYGASERALFIIDKQGIIRFIDVHPIDEQPDNEELFEVLRKLES